MSEIFLLFSEATRRTVAALPVVGERPPQLRLPDYVPCCPIGACFWVEWGSRFPHSMPYVLGRHIAARRQAIEGGSMDGLTARYQRLCREFTGPWDDGKIPDLAAAMGVAAGGAA